MESIDRRTVALLDQASGDMNAHVTPTWPRRGTPDGVAGPIFGPDPIDLATRNPGPGELQFTPRSAAAVATTRIALDDQATATLFGIEEAIAYAVANSREYADAAEAYVVVALQLLIERHLWGPRFFDDVRVNTQALGDDGVYNATVSVVNDFSVRQRLPYGGEMSASILAQAVEDLSRRVTDESFRTAEAILAAEVPLLRGAGLVAREDLIQSERNLIYAARGFERFRREFVFSIARDFLDLVVSRQAIDNAQRQLLSLEQAEARERALFEAGRQAGFQLGLAAQDTLFARDSLVAQQEAFRLSVDRFKVRIGMPTEQPLAIRADGLGLPTPQIASDRAVALGLDYRLDLQTERDRLDDSRRQVDIAKNNLLPGLNVGGSIRSGGEPSESFRFDLDDTDFTGTLALSLPLDREIERVRLRQAQIALEQAGRRFSRTRDEIAVEIRNAVRQIDRAVFSIRLQEENVRIAGLREASIEAAPGRASARDRSDAINARLRAEDGLAQSQRDLQVAIMGYLLATDQLRVGPDGAILPLSGMALADG